MSNNTYCFKCQKYIDIENIPMFFNWKNHREKYHKESA